MSSLESRHAPRVSTVLAVPFQYGDRTSQADEYVRQLMRRSWSSRDGRASLLWHSTQLPRGTRDLAPPLARVFSSDTRGDHPWRVHNLYVKDAKQFFEKRLVVDSRHGEIPVAAAIHRMEVAIYPVGVAILYIELRWDLASDTLQRANEDLDGFTDRLANWIRVLRQLRQQNDRRFAEHWMFPAPAQQSHVRPGQSSERREHAAVSLMSPRLQGAARGEQHVSLAELTHWFVSATDEEAKQGFPLDSGTPATPAHPGGGVSFDDTPTYGWTYTTLVWPEDPSIDEASVSRLLFRLARGAPSSQLPPRDLATHVRCLRENRAIGSWREGFAAISWYRDGLHEDMEMKQWPSDLLDHYLHVALFLCAERDALQELTCEIGQLAFEFASRGTSPDDRNSLPRLLERLDRHVRFTAGFVGEDSGGNSDMAAFFQLIRCSLRTPQVLAEYRAEVEEMMRYADTLYEQKLHDIARRDSEKESQFQRRVQATGVGMGVAAIVTGIFGMNWDSIAGGPNLATWTVLAVLAGISGASGLATGWWLRRRLLSSDAASSRAGEQQRQLPG